MSRVDEARTDVDGADNIDGVDGVDGADGADGVRTVGGDLGTTPEETLARPVGIGVLGWARWAWRQLTSMRTALVLLFLLALASVPGSVLPQRRVDPGAVTRYFREQPTLAPWLDRFSLFDVFTSPWFSAIYLLLFASLVGCVLPRSRQHWRAMRAQPPTTPRHLDRLPVSRQWESDADVAAALAGARDVLRRSRFRVRTSDDAVSAEKGYLRETGNLLFHLSLVVLLVALAWGRTSGFRADVIVVEGAGFSNAVPLYDTFEPGLRFSDRSLVPFSVRLEDLDVRYQEGGDQSGAPRDFRAAVDDILFTLQQAESRSSPMLAVSGLA